MRAGITPRAPAAPDTESGWAWLLIALAAVGVYFVGRYGGSWAEYDSAAFAVYTRDIMAAGALLPGASESVYQHGFGFQALSLFLLHLTGISVPSLQQLVYPLLIGVIVVPAWVLYREVVGSARGATFTTLLLLVQPEFLFVMLRSSHEKFTRVLLVVCLFALVRSFTLHQRPGALAVYVGIFYTGAFSMIAVNNLMASSFFAAVALALLLAWLLPLAARRQVERRDGLVRRLGYATVICMVLVYIFTFYTYPPAQHNLLVLRDIWQRLAALFLDVDGSRNNAYATIASSWVSMPVYMLLSVANWAVLLGSAAIWARQSWRWLRRGERPATRARWVLWLLYTAFAAQGAISVLVDVSGALGANLQHRIFPSFSILAVALIGAELEDWSPRRLRWVPRVVLPALIGCVAVLSVLKATNEPTLSNKWVFYDQAELRAMQWGDAHLREAEVWTEFDERLDAAFLMAVGPSAAENRFVGYRPRQFARTMLLSDVTRARAERLNQPLPLPPQALRIYDNGSAELYRLRLATPFQQ